MVCLYRSHQAQWRANLLLGSKRDDDWGGPGPPFTNDLGQKVKIIRPFSWKYRTEDYGPEADEYVVKCPLYGLKCAKGERKSLGLRFSK